MTSDRLIIAGPSTGSLMRTHHRHPGLLSGPHPVQQRLAGPQPHLGVVVL
jgi:hypothetical protein